MKQAKQSPALEPGFTKAREGTGAQPFYRTKPQAGTQCAEVLDLLLAGRALTHLDAWREAGTSRLAAHVHELRRKGWPIEAHIIAVKGRKGRMSRIACYVLPEAQDGHTGACMQPESDSGNGG
ncbi:hypothetical protein CO614_10800 [Lysobacteraceae bacterium NML120232]|nr:hypothetical protein CO614_10800 [Xanthomonadaceae bacterium NML120232]PJK11055.1 hypothetical protein CO608_00875 [Xanthomonadaceae bacterium NML08-0793]